MLRASSTLNTCATDPDRIQANDGLIAKLNAGLESIERSEQQYPATVVVSAPGLDPWSWLQANQGMLRLVWAERGEQEIAAGVGAAATVEVLADDDAAEVTRYCRDLLNGNSEIRFYGGFSFDGQDAWDQFGAGRFVAPRFLLKSGELRLTVMGPDDVDQAKLDLQRLSVRDADVELNLPTPTAKTYSPTADGWQSNVDEALTFIRSEVLEKVVLARKTLMEFDEPLNPVALTARMFDTTHDCFVFCFDFGEQVPQAFLGATPERLFARKSNELRSEVVAGTRKRGGSSGEDQRLAYELLTSDKDQLEHDIVRKSIRQKLHKFVDHLDVDSHASVLRLAHKQHLCSEVQGTLKDDVEDGHLLKRLHPTPAVGGYPTENALPEISRLEPFNRGWYAAPIGWIGAESAEFVVAIRSGLVEGKTLSLYSGAGIVKGSDPDEEWKEVESKIQDFVEILGSEANTA